MKPVLDKIQPKAEEKKKIKELARAVVGEIRAKGYEARVMGSVAKGTWISKDVDLDVFVFFDQEADEKKLEREGLKIGKAVFEKLHAPWEIGYAQHPYVRGIVEDMKIDIVPCYKLKKAGIKSAVDRTPFHTSYVKSQLNEKGRQEVLLLKQFLKGQGLYGSELRVEGFSGYLVELLIIRYGSFKNVINAARNWKEGKVVDIREYYTNKEHPRLGEMFKSPLIVVDPVDENRNVAAVLNEKNFKKFVAVAGKYHKKPSEDFFFPKPVKPLPLQKVPNLLFVVLRHDKVVEDILWPQMRKTVESLSNELGRNGFKVKRTGVWSNGVSILFLETDLKTKPTYEHLGPPVGMGGHAKAFKKKNPGAKVKKGRLVAVKKRRHASADAFAKNFLKKGMGLGSHLQAKGAEVLIGKSIGPYYEQDLAEYFTKWLKD